MTIFYGTPIPPLLQVGQWTGDNLSELESWLGTDITVNEDDSITFTPAQSAHGIPPITLPLNGYLTLGGLEVIGYTSDPTALGGPLQPFTPGQTYTLSS